MNQLPDVPKIANPAVYQFMSEVRRALKKLAEDVAAIPDPTTITSILHTAISDFDEAVQDVIGGNLTAGTNVQIVYNDGTGLTNIAAVHTHPTSDIVSLTEFIQDTVAGFMVAGTNMLLTYDDTLNTLTVTNTGTGGGGGGPYTSADITDFAEASRDVIGAALVAGTGITITVNDAADTITIAATGGGSYTNPQVLASEHGVLIGNSAATNSTNLNSLISTLNGAGGGTIIMDQAGSVQISSTINLKSKVGIQSVKGHRFTWTGSASGTCFQTSTTDVMVHSRYQFVIDEGANFNGTVLDLHSMFYCDFEVIGMGGFYPSTGTGLFASIRADSTAGEVYGVAQNRNVAFCKFDLRHIGTVYKFLYIAGITSGFGGDPQGVTLNTFYNAQSNICYYRGIQIEQWADSNTFAGNTYIGLFGLNGVGVFCNEGNPTVETGVYNTVWEHLAVDTFGTGLNRTGVIFNKTKLMYINAFFQNPLAELGMLNVSNSISYQIRSIDGATNNIYIHEKGVNRGL